MKPEKLIKLKEDEEIMAVVHKSLLPSLPKLVLFTVWFIVPFFFLFLFINQGTIGWVIFVAIILPAMFLLLRFFHKWNNTILLITNNRVADINQIGLFEREITQTRFRDIDEVHFKVKGVIPTIFRLGQIRLVTAGEAGNIEFVLISRPQKIHSLINDLCEHYHDQNTPRPNGEISKIAERTSTQELEKRYTKKSYD